MGVVNANADESLSLSLSLSLIALSSRAALASVERAPVDAEMLDRSTLVVRIAPGAIVEQLELVVHRAGQPIAAIAPVTDHATAGIHTVVFLVPDELQDDWSFMELVFDQALLDRRVARAWSVGLMFRCDGAHCAATDEVEWGLATGLLRRITDSNGRELLDADLQRQP